MTNTRSPVFRPLLTLLLALLTAAPGQTQDARELSIPTTHLTYVDQSEAQITARVAQGYRVTDLEYRSGSGSATRFDVNMVANSGAYQQTWWWYYNRSVADVTNLINQNQGRLIDVERYVDASGTVRYAVVMVSNTGTNQKAWWWYTGASVSALSNAISTNNGRLVDIERYTVLGASRYVAIMIANTGADQRAWWWYADRTQAQVTSLVNTNNARLYDLERRASGNFDCIMVQDPQPKYWYWWTALSASQVASKLGTYGSRAIDIEHYTVNGADRYAVLAINNSNALTTTVGNQMRATTDGDVGAWLQRVNGTNYANLNGHAEFEPASTMKTLHHAHAMRRIYLNQAQLNTPLTVYTAYSATNTSCPVDNNPITEALTTVLRKMMENSDNARTQAVTAHFGEANINTTATLLGMTNTSLNHRLGCGLEAVLNPNAMTLKDLHSLHSTIANGWLGPYRDHFYEHMLDSVSDLSIEAMIDSEAALIGLPAATVATFKNFCRVAHKGGNYTLSFLGATWIDRAEFGWISLPAISNGTLIEREFTFGAWVNSASNDNSAWSAIYNKAIPGLLRQQIHNALQSWTTALAGIQTVGAGCGNPVYTQTASTLPRINTTVSYTGHAGYPNALTAFAMGLSSTSWNGVPLPASLAPIGGEPGCIVSNDVVTAELALSNGNGNRTFAFTIPNSTAVVGFEYLTQFWSIGSSSMRTSNSLRSIVGL